MGRRRLGRSHGALGTTSRNGTSSYCDTVSRAADFVELRASILKAEAELARVKPTVGRRPARLRSTRSLSLPRHDLLRLATKLVRNACQPGRSSLPGLPGHRTVLQVVYPEALRTELGFERSGVRLERRVCETPCTGCVDQLRCAVKNFKHLLCVGRGVGTEGDSSAAR